ncbi:MAG: tetratricopeptide repeat protein [Actinomycetota bacterium]|nr:tetratricopeptide repeat protein [Actinomycetota bacterium]
MKVGARLPVPGLEPQLERLIALVAEMERGGRGSIVFLAGPEGSGQEALLSGLAAEIGRSHGRVQLLAGTMESGRYETLDRAGSPHRHAVSLLDSVISLAAPFQPVAALAAQVISQSKVAWRLASELRSGTRKEHPFVLMPRLLRAAAEAGPVALLIEGADGAPGGWWADLVLGFGTEIACELPLLMVLAVDGPQRLGDDKESDPEMLLAARRLANRSLAEWVSLPGFELEDLRRWIGAADEAVLRSLRDVTHGRSGWAAELWADWRRRGVVDDMRAGRWQFTPGGEERALAPVSDLLTRRLPPEVQEKGVTAVEQARELLSCAALEGRRFTVDAIALALRLDRDDVIDFLDDGLTADDEGTSALLVEAGRVDVDDEDGRRTLWRSRFSTQLDWMTLHHYGLTATERQQRAASLAPALQRLYGAEAHRVAHVIARLYGLAGDHVAADRFRRTSRLGVERDVLVWRARRVLAAPEPEDRLERQRAGEVLLAAATSLYTSGPFPDGLTFAEAARRLAVRTRDRAYALYLAAWFLSRMRDDERARPCLEQALREYEACRDALGTADARYQLASIELRAGRHEAARAPFLEVLEVRRAVGDTDGEATVHQALADVEQGLGQPEAARDHYSRALEIAVAGTDRHHEAMIRYEIATLDLEEERYDAAEEGYRRALPLIRETRDPHGESLIRAGLGGIAWEREDLASARSHFEAAAALCGGVGDLHGQAINLENVAAVDLEQDDLIGARQRLAQALEIMVEIGGSEESIADIRGGIATIDEKLGREGGGTG